MNETATGAALDELEQKLADAKAGQTEGAAKAWIDRVLDANRLKAVLGEG